MKLLEILILLIAVILGIILAILVLSHQEVSLISNFLTSSNVEIQEDCN
jgi:hypothetical protein